MKKLVYGVLLSSACAGLLIGYHDVSRSNISKTDVTPKTKTTSTKRITSEKQVTPTQTVQYKSTRETEIKTKREKNPDMQKKHMTTRPKHTIENDMKNTEKKMNDLDKRIANESDTNKKQVLQKHRDHEAKRLQRLDDELNRAK